MKTLIPVILLISIFLIAGLGAHFESYEAKRGFSIEVVSDEHELLKLIPNQPYAYIGSDGKLYVDISPNHPKYPGYGAGLSPDTVYAFDCVFFVENSLWENQSITYRINSSSPSVKMYTPASNIHNSPQTATQNLVFALEWMNRTCIGFVFDMRNGQTVGVSLNATI